MHISRENVGETAIPDPETITVDSERMNNMRIWEEGIRPPAGTRIMLASADGTDTIDSRVGE
jgi:hypothetical protein